MSHASWEVQKAIFEVLAADATLTELLGGASIYDRAPPDASFPYVTFADASAEDWSTQTSKGQLHIMTLDIWSRGAGRAEPLGIAEAIEAALTTASFSLAGHQLINLHLAQTEIGIDEDGETFHGMLQYRVVTEAI